MQRQAYTDLKRGQKGDLGEFLSKSYMSTKKTLCKLADSQEENFLNVYIFGLLHRIALGEFSSFERRYVSDFEHEVFYFVQESPDPKFRLYVYKANADYRLVRLGLFGVQSRLGTRNANIEIAKRYYSFASAFLSQIPSLKRRHFIDGSKNIFDLLGNSLENCLEILEHMATEEFDLLDFNVTNVFLDQTLNKGRLAVLKQRYIAKWDEYLDCKDKVQQEKLSAEITHLAAGIKEIDPSFILPKFKKENI